jgi:enoyl-CoA hydratase/carnithine racemase
MPGVSPLMLGGSAGGTMATAEERERPMEFEQITTERRDGVIVLTLNRPDRLNAWTPRMNAELTDAIEAADADESVGAVVVTGAGRGFCAGADIEAIFAAQLEGDETVARSTVRRNWVDLVRSTKPIVAAVNGVAVGVGLTMILPFDRIIASGAARFSLRFVKMGLVPELASSFFLPARVGWSAASDLMLSGRMIDAAAAVEIGLADRLVDPDDLVDRAVEQAREYGENPARQLRWIKELLTMNAAESDPTAVQRRELEYLQRAYASEEHAAAVQAFLQRKRS